MADMQVVEGHKMQSDLDTYEEVIEAIEALNIVRETHAPIEVQVSGGVTTLSGVVPSKIARRLVVYAAASVPSVSKVVDQLIEDSQIVMAVGAALAADPSLSAYQLNIRVTSYLGEVILYGGPVDEAQQPRAMEIAAKVGGVRRVTGKLTSK